MQAQIVSHALRIPRDYQRHGFAFLPVDQIRAFLKGDHKALRLLRHDRLKFRPVLLLIGIAEGHAKVVELDLSVLVVDDPSDGILDAEAGQEQGRTAADPEHHHEKSLLIPENISDGNLHQEGEPVPEQRDPFQKDPFAALGGLRAHQLGRHLRQLIPAGGKGGSHGAQDGHRQGYRAQPPVHQKHKISHGIHDPVGEPDHGREQPGAHKKADQAAQDGRASGIKQVDPHDPCLSIAKRLQYADLRPLLLHHARHGGHADQRRHQEEKDGENAGDPFDDAGIALIAGIADIFIPGQNIGIRLLQIGKLLSCIRKLLFRLRHLLFKLPQAFFIILPAVGKLLLCVGKLLLRLSQPLLIPGDLFPGRRDLRLSHIDEPQPRIQLRFVSKKLRFGQVQAALHAVPLVLILQIGGLGFPVGELLPAVRKLRLAVRKLLSGIRERALIFFDLSFRVLDLSPAVVDLLLAVLDLLLTVFQLLPGVRELLLCLSPVFGKLSLPVLDLPFGVLLQGKISLLRQLLRKRLRPVLRRLHRVVVFPAVQPVPVLQEYIDIRIIIRIKAVLRKINEPLQPPASQRRGAPLVVDIIRGIAQPDDGIFRIAEHVRRILIVVFRYPDRGAERILPISLRVHHALVSGGGLPSRRHHRLVQLPQHGMRPQDAFLPGLIHRQKIRIDLAFGDLHILSLIDGLHGRVVIADGGHQTQIVKPVFFQIILSRRQHVRLRHRQAHVQSDSQRHNGKDRQISPQTLLNLPHRRFYHGRFHVSLHSGASAAAPFSPRPACLCALPLDLFHRSDVFVDLHALHRAALYPDDPVRHGGQRLVVRDHHHGHPGTAAGILQKLQDRLSRIIIQRSGRLVAQKQLGILRKRPGDRHPLLLPAGELSREVSDPLRKPHLFQGLRRVQRILRDLGGQLHVFQRRQILDQVIKLKHKADVISAVGGELLLRVGGDLLPVQDHAPFRQGIHAAQDIQDRGLSCAGRADDHAELPFLDLKIHIPQGLDVHLAHMVDLFHIFKFHKGHAQSLLLFQHRLHISPVPQKDLQLLSRLYGR